MTALRAGLQSVPPAVLDQALADLVATRTLRPDGKGRIASASEWVARAKQGLAALGANGAAFTPSQACHALGATRRHVLPLLEHLDRQGITQRAGSVRTLR